MAPSRPTSDWLIDLFFRHWHPVNDQFLIEHEASISWKAYVCNRPHPDELLFRFFQGPTFVAWPRRRVEDFKGFVDHELPELCCASWREIYVVNEARDCLALDLTRDDLVDELALADFPRVHLLQNLFNAHAIKDIKLIYGLRTCRLHRGDRDATEMQRNFDRVVDPLILLALAERKVRRRFGSWAAFVFRNFCILNTHTLGFILGPFSARLAHRWRDVDPLATDFCGFCRRRCPTRIAERRRRTLCADRRIARSAHAGAAAPSIEAPTPPPRTSTS